MPDIDGTGVEELALLGAIKAEVSSPERDGEWTPNFFEDFRPFPIEINDNRRCLYVRYSGSASTYCVYRQINSPKSDPTGPWRYRNLDQTVTNSPEFPTYQEALAAVAALP